MKFVDELPSYTEGRSRYDQMIGPSDIERLKKNPGKWALIAEDKPKSWQSGLVAWACRKGLRAATRTTIPGGSEIDMYVCWPETEATA